MENPINNIVKTTKENLQKGVNSIKNAVGGSKDSPKPEKPELKDLGQRKLVELAQEFNKNLPLFERAGFKLKHLEIEINLSPKFIVHFHIQRQISEEEKLAVLKEISGKRILKMVMEALFKASGLKEYLKVGGLNFLGVAIHVGAIPTVRVLFGEPAI